MIKKRAYPIQMSYEVSDTEKVKAQQALLCFKSTRKLLQQASDYLNIMKTPFKNNPDISGEEIMKARAAVRRFRDKSIQEFNQFKEAAFRCVNAMQVFSSDTQSVKLMKSMITDVDDLENKVNNFSDLFNDLQSKDFVKNVISSIEDIQKQCDDIDQVIDERVVPHIQNNILATSWVDSISQDLDMKIEKQTPLILDLYNQRQDQLNDAIKERSTVGN